MIYFQDIEVKPLISSKKTTKDNILELLKKHVQLTVSELTHQLQITDMAVRKHISSMEKDGLIQSKEIKQPMGRPIQHYSLSEKGEMLFPKSYEGISVEFLQEIQNLHGTDSITHLFQHREQRLTREISTRMHNKSEKEKVEELGSIQNEKGYMPEVTEVDDNKFELIEYNCPIMAIASEFKVACQCETSMFKKVLQTEKIERISCKTEGNDHCRFMIEF